MSTDTNDRIPSCIADLADSGEGVTISGVAIGAGDVTRGLEDTRKVWPADELQPAADTLAGQRPNLLHSTQTVGSDVRAGWDPDREAVVYELDIDDPKLARQARDDQLAVSIEASHADGGHDEDADAMRAADIEFTGLAIDRVGASPSQSVDTGPSEALAAELSAAEIEAALASTVAGVTFSDTMGGELDEADIPTDDFEDHYLYPGDTKSESSYPVVDADGNLRRGNVDAAHQLGARGDIDADEHNRRLMALAEEFENPPEWAADEQADESRTPDDPVSPEHGPGEASADSATNNPEQSPMTDESEPTDPEDDRITALASTVDGLAEQVSDLADTVDDDEPDEDEQAISEAKLAYAEALTEDSALSAEVLAEECSLSALKEQFDNHDTATLADPDPEPTVQSGGGDGTEQASLSDADRAKIDRLKSEAAMWERRDEPDRADTLRDRIDDIKGGA